MRMTWKRGITIGAATVVALYFLLPSALSAVAGSLIRTDAPTRTDAVIALAGDPRSLREQKAAELYKQGLAGKVVVSGIPLAWGAHTGEAARSYLLRLGIPASDVFVLKESWNTRREATGFALLMRRHGWQSAILVTSPFHSRRARYTFQRAAPDLNFFSAPVPAQPPEWRPERWWARRGDMGITVREFFAWGNTLLLNLS